MRFVNEPRSGCGLAASGSEVGAAGGVVIACKEGSSTTLCDGPDFTHEFWAHFGLVLGFGLLLLLCCCCLCCYACCKLCKKKPEEPTSSGVTITSSADDRA